MSLKNKKIKKLRPKNYDYCTEIKKEATATQTLFYFSETFLFFLTISQLLQEEKFIYKTGKHKKPRNKFYFSPLFHYFPITQTKIEHKSNINLIK